MANYVDELIKVALNEVGYLEKSKEAYEKDHAVLNYHTKGHGYDNYTKYGRDMHNIEPSVMDFPAYWCDAFVDWCFYKAYGKTQAKKLLCGGFNDYTVASATLYNNKKRLDRTPKVGAQVFFTKNGKISGCYHTGIVYKVDKNYFYTIEGNTASKNGVVENGGAVAKKKYSTSLYKDKALFGHPQYDKVETLKNGLDKTNKTNKVRYYKKYLGKSPSLVDAMNEMKLVSTFQNRERIAKSNNIEEYKGTALQNNKLLRLLKKGKLVKP